MQILQRERHQEIQNWNLTILWLKKKKERKGKKKEMDKNEKKQLARFRPEHRKKAAHRGALENNWRVASLLNEPGRVPCAARPRGFAEPGAEPPPPLPGGLPHTARASGGRPQARGTLRGSAFKPGTWTAPRLQPFGK